MRCVLMAGPRKAVIVAMSERVGAGANVLRMNYPVKFGLNYRLGSIAPVLMGSYYSKRLRVG